MTAGSNDSSNVGVLQDEGCLNKHLTRKVNLADLKHGFIDHKEPRDLEDFGICSSTLTNIALGNSGTW